MYTGCPKKNVHFLRNITLCFKEFFNITLFGNAITSETLLLLHTNYNRVYYQNSLSLFNLTQPPGC